MKVAAQDFCNEGKNHKYDYSYDGGAYYDSYDSYDSYEAYDSEGSCSGDRICGFSPSDVEELACQGVKPWDDDAGDVLAALYGDYEY